MSRKESPPSPHPSLSQLQIALQASWDRCTAHLGAFQSGNPALGQCYPTSRVVQWFYPRFDIVVGEVDTGSAIEAHFWNIDEATEPAAQVDLTWQQFPETSRVLGFRVLDRHALGDSSSTVLRCRLLLQRVIVALGQQQPSERLEAPEKCSTIGIGAEVNLADAVAISRSIFLRPELLVRQM